MTTSELTEYNLDLVRLLARNTSIFEFERYAGRCLGNPLMITDESFFVLAYSKNVHVFDPIWEEIISKQYSPSQLVIQTDVNRFWERLENSSVPLFVDDAAFKGMNKRVVTRIRLGAKTKGYVVLLEYEKKIEQNDLIFLQMLAEVLAVRITKEDAVSEAIGKMKAEFARELLLGNNLNENMVKERAKLLKLTLGKHYTILAVHPKEESLSLMHTVDDIASLIKRQATMCVYTVKGSMIYYIVGYSQKDNFKKIIKNSITGYMEKNNYYCFVSRSVDELIELNKCYDEVNAMKHFLVNNQANNCMHFYEYEAAIDMIVYLYESEKKKLFSCHAFTILLESDQKENTCYIETLRCFFRNNQNVAMTAKELHLHRNTINYRLRKIQELLGEAFDDYRVRLHIQMAIIAFDFVQMNKK